LALNHGCFCCGKVSEAENYFLDEDKSKDEYSVMGRKKLTAWRGVGQNWQEKN
jgi:hypothetical protein